MSSKKQIAIQYVETLFRQELPDDLITPDFKNWTASRGEMSGDELRATMKKITSVLDGPLKGEVVGITEEGSRVAVEAIATSTLINGVQYKNAYHFLMIFSGDKIASVKAHNDSAAVKEQLYPLLFPGG